MATTSKPKELDAYSAQRVAEALDALDGALAGTFTGTVSFFDGPKLKVRYDTDECLHVAVVA